MGSKKKTVWYLKGDPTMPAYRVGSPKKDECGQTPWLFIDGKWKGDTVYVAPWKMKREVHRDADHRPLTTDHCTCDATKAPFSKN